MKRRERHGRSRSPRRRSSWRPSDDVPLLIAYGEPAAIAERDQTRLLVGLFGALLAIGSALVMAASLNGGAPT